MWDDTAAGSRAAILVSHAWIVLVALCLSTGNACTCTHREQWCFVQLEDQQLGRATGLASYPSFPRGAVSNAGELPDHARRLACRELSSNEPAVASVIGLCKAWSPGGDGVVNIEHGALNRFAVCEQDARDGAPPVYGLERMLESSDLTVLERATAQESLAWIRRIAAVRDAYLLSCINEQPAGRFTFSDARCGEREWEDNPAGAFAPH